MEKVIEGLKDRKLIFEWIFAIGVAVLMMVTFAYIDLKSLTIWTTNLWDVIAKGDITQYFAYTAENVYNAPHQYVSGTLYSLIPWAIWNLPIWVAQHFFNKPILSNSIMLIWSQLFLVVCLVGVLYFVRKITMRTTNDKVRSNLATFLTFSSVWMYVGVFYAGQNDIMICLLGLASVYASMKKNTKLFLILGGFAISVKYFFFFPFVAVILLTEKNIYKIIAKTVIGLVPTLLFNVVCRRLPMFIESSNSGPADKMLKQLFLDTVPGVGTISISLFILGLVFVLFLAYITKPKQDERDKFIVYMSALSLVPVLMFTNIQFYRTILIIPFLVILMMQNKKILKLNIILEIIMEIGILLTFVLKDKFLFAPRKGSLSILPKLLDLNNNKVMTVGQRIKELVPMTGKILPVFATVGLAMIIILMVINHPRFKDKYIEFKEENFERFWLWIRPVSVLMCTLGMYYSIIKG